MEKIFESGGGPQYQALILRARIVNAERDEEERAVGFAAPCSDLRSLEGISSAMRTAISAIVCGIDLDDWNAAAEGLAILQDVEVSIRELARERRAEAVIREDAP